MTIAADTAVARRSTVATEAGILDLHGRQLTGNNGVQFCPGDPADDLWDALYKVVKVLVPTCLVNDLLQVVLDGFRGVSEPLLLHGDRRR